VLWGWIVFISIFLIQNYGRRTIWPHPILLTIPLSIYRFIHSTCGMLFAGSIITTTILEWNVVANVESQQKRQKMMRMNQPSQLTTTTSTTKTTTTPMTMMSVPAFWFHQATIVERNLVLPALTGLIVSGVGQCFLTYGTGVKYAPLHIKSSLHLLTLFGIWWAWTDRTTQGPALEEAIRIMNQPIEKVETVRGTTQTFLPSLWYRRRISNVVSCLFLLALYGLMSLKPGYVG
jgi:hypothetical protein